MLLVASPRSVLVWTVLTLSALSLPGVASAQEPPSTAVFQTQVPAELGDLGGALDRVLRSTLDDIDVIRITGSLALDLEQAQLGLGCLAESAECFGTMADQNGVEVLVAPRLEASGDEVVLTLLRFDDRDDSLRQVTRRLPQDSGAILDSVPALVRELFELPEPEPEEPDGRDGTDPQEPSTPPADDGIGPAGPVLLGVGGAAFLGGVVAGVLFNGAQSDYEDFEVTRDNVDDANDKLDAATRRGRAATALIIGGGVIAAAGLVWLLVDLLGGDEPDDEARARLTPIVGMGPGAFEAGLRLEGDLW